MAHMTYEKSKRLVYVGLVILAVITLIEVVVSLVSKGYLISGLEGLKYTPLVAGVILVLLSLYKARYIIFEFMHLKYEVRTLAFTILFPCILLVWAIIAFFQEGSSWADRRQLIKDYNSEQVKSDVTPVTIDGVDYIELKD